MPEQATAKRKPLTLGSVAIGHRKTGRGVLMSGAHFRAMTTPEALRRGHRRAVGKEALGTGVIGTAIGGLVGGRPGALIGGGIGTAAGGIRGHLRARKTRRFLTAVRGSLVERGYDI